MTEKQTKEIENLKKMLKEAVEAFAKDMERKLTYSENEKKYFQEDLTQAKKEYEILEKFTRAASSGRDGDFTKRAKRARETRAAFGRIANSFSTTRGVFHKERGCSGRRRVTDGGEVEQKHLSILKEYQQRAINAEEQLFSATEQAEAEASLHLENLKSTEREKQVLEDRLRKEEQKVASLRQG